MNTLNAKEIETILTGSLSYEQFLINNIWYTKNKYTKIDVKNLISDTLYFSVTSFLNNGKKRLEISISVANGHINYNGIITKKQVDYLKKQIAENNLSYLHFTSYMK